MERKKHTQKKMFTVFSIQSSFFGHLNQPRRKVTNESGHAIESVTEMQKTHLNTGQVKVRYSDVSVIQIPIVCKDVCLMAKHGKSRKNNCLRSQFHSINYAKSGWRLTESPFYLLLQHSITISLKHTH